MDPPTPFPYSAQYQTYLSHSQQRPTCPVCGIVTRQYSHLYHHALEAHDLKLDSSFSCRDCDCICKNQRGVWGHWNRTHKPNGPMKLRKVTSEEMEGEKVKKEEAGVDTTNTPCFTECAVSPTPLKPSSTSFELLPVSCPICLSRLSRSTASAHLRQHHNAVCEAYYSLEDVPAKLAVTMAVLGCAQHRE